MMACVVVILVAAVRRWVAAAKGTLPAVSR